MKIGKERYSQTQCLIKLTVSFVLSFIISGDGINAACQHAKPIENTTLLIRNKTSQNSEDEVQNLIAILKDKDAKIKTPELIYKVMEQLGRLKAQEAIPELIDCLDYKRRYEWEAPEESGIVNEIHTITPAGRYPAVSALFQIGKPALPLLIKVMETEESNSVRSQNALYTIQIIFREDITEAIEYLKKSMSKSTAQNAKIRLQTAIEKTREQQLELQKLKSTETERKRIKS